MTNQKLQPGRFSTSLYLQTVNKLALWVAAKGPVTLVKNV